MKNLKLITLILLCITLSEAKETLVFATGKGAEIQKISQVVLKEAYKKLGYDIKFKFYPNARAIKAANSGKIDGETSRIKGINKKFKNLIPIDISINFLEGYAFSKNTNIKIQSWDDLKKFSIVSTRGVKFLEKNLKKHEVNTHVVNQFTSAIEMVSKGRKDIGIFTKINAIKAIRTANIKNIKAIGDPLVSVKLYHYVHKKNKHLVSKLKDILYKMEQSGRISKIRAEYIKKNNLEL